MPEVLPSGEVVGHLLHAAATVSPIAPTVALELYRQALAVLDCADDRALEIEVARLEVLARSGHVDEAMEQGRALLERHRARPQRDAIRAAMAAVAATAGDLVTSARHDRAGATTSHAVRRCLATSQEILLGRAPDEIADEMRRALAREPSDEVACIAHQGLGLCHGAAGRYEQASAEALVALSHHDPRTMSRAGFVMPDVWVGSFAAFADRFEEATTVFERVGYEAERRGEVSTLVHTGAGLAMVSFFAGRWDDARREAEQVLAIGEETGARAHEVTAHALLASVASAQHRTAEAAEHLAAGRAAIALDRHLFGSDLLAWASAKVAAGGGRVGAALDELWRNWELTRSLRGLTQFRVIAPELVRWAVVEGRQDLARSVVDDLADVARASACPSVEATALRCLGLATGDVDHLVEAAELMRTTPWRTASLSADDDASAALATISRGNRTRATAEAGRAAEPQRRPVSGERAMSLAPLSPREAQVVELVRAGLSNPEISERLFISRRTVESHISSALRKLNVPNRTRLAVVTTPSG